MDNFRPIWSIWKVLGELFLVLTEHRAYMFPAMVTHIIMYCTSTTSSLYHILKDLENFVSLRICGAFLPFYSFSSRDKDSGETEFGTLPRPSMRSQKCTKRDARRQKETKREGRTVDTFVTREKTFVILLSQTFFFFVRFSPCDYVFALPQLLNERHFFAAIKKTSRISSMAFRHSLSLTKQQ